MIFLTIWLYSGKPGSGKSYHSTKDIYDKVRRKDNRKNKVIANYVLNFDNEKLQNNFIYKDNSEITIDYLVDYAKNNHEVGFEGQTLVVLDEAGTLFNSRNWNSNAGSRMEWIKFFSLHRKLGFNFILVAQQDRMIDKQIRGLIEYDISHMKINNFFWMLPFTFFLAVERWYGQNMKMGHTTIPYRKKIANMYDSYAMF